MKKRVLIPSLNREDTVKCRKDAIAIVRQAIMDQLSRNIFYVILADRMDDPKHYTGSYPECLFGSLNLITHKL